MKPVTSAKPSGLESPITTAVGHQDRARVHLPTSFDEIVDEIVRFTEIPRLDAERRVWMQALEPGSNVLEDVRRFGVTPHEYDDRMLRLYRDGDGFIFETLVFWAKPMRSSWTRHALDRIRAYTERTARCADEVDVLVLGDGAGNDSLFLADHGFRVHYFDVPGSRTFDFAMQRFEHHGLLGDRIRLVSTYEACLQRQYDVVVCFEVLEHLPDPLRAIRDLGAMLRTGGIALITEDFGDIVDHLPTHLRVSSKLVGTTPFLFLRSGLALSWYATEFPFKPMEFERVARVTMAHRWRLWRDFRVRGAYLGRHLNVVTRRLEKLPYLGG